MTKGYLKILASVVLALLLPVVSHAIGVGGLPLELEDDIVDIAPFVIGEVIDLRTRFNTSGAYWKSQSGNSVTGKYDKSTYVVSFSEDTTGCRDTFIHAYIGSISGLRANTRYAVKLRVNHSLGKVPTSVSFNFQGQSYSSTNYPSYFTRTSSYTAFSGVFTTPGSLNTYAFGQLEIYGNSFSNTNFTYQYFTVEELPPLVTITPNSGIGGSITPSEVLSVEKGSSKSFTITPDEGYQVKDVKVNGTSVGAVSSYTFVSIQANSTITAEFEPATYTITPSAGAGGSISPDEPQVLVHGSSQMFTVTPDEGYIISDVLVNGASVGAVSSYTFEDVRVDGSIDAEFETLPVVVMQASASAGGGIAPSGDISAMLGSSQTFSISPVSGYRIKDVLVNGVSVGAVSSYTLDNIQADDSIIAVFEPLPIGSDVIATTADSLGAVVSQVAMVAGSACAVGLLLFSFLLIIRILIKSTNVFVG